MNSPQVLARLAQAEKHIEQLLGAKGRELSLESELARVEKERCGLAEELNAATKQIQELQAEIQGYRAEVTSLRKHMAIKNVRITTLEGMKADWMTRRYEDCRLDTPPKRFDLSSPAAESTPMSLGPAQQKEHETPAKPPFNFGADAMASSPQVTDGQPQAAADVPESAAPAALAPSEARAARPESPPG